MEYSGVALRAIATKDLLRSSAGSPRFLTGRIPATPEYLTRQVHVAVVCAANLFRSTLSGRIDDEDLGASLSRVHQDGFLDRLDDWAAIGTHPDASKVLNDWIAHFAGWFGKMVRDCNIPVEIAQQRIEGFQACLVDHLHHMQDIWRDHTKRELPAIDAWNAMEWMDPALFVESDGQRDFRYLYQTVLIPDVKTDTDGTRLEIPVPPRCKAQLILPLDLYTRLPEEAAA